MGFCIHTAPSPMNRPSHNTAHNRVSPSSGGSSQALRIALEGAKRVLKRRFRVALLIRDAYAHLNEHARPLQGVRHDLATLLRLLRAWALRQYQHVPWTPLLLIAGAVTYFVMPADLIPDVLAGLGFMDDMAVVSAVVRAVHDELEQFRMWESTAPAAPPVSEPAPRESVVHKSAA